MFLLYFLLWYYSIRMSSKFPTTTKTTLNTPNTAQNKMNDMGKGGLMGGTNNERHSKITDSNMADHFPQLLQVSLAYIAQYIYICVCMPL